MSLLASLVLFTLAAPVLAVVAIIIKLDSKGPVFYSQERVGMGGRNFKMLKFRTMRTDAEAAGVKWAQKNDPRVTRIGKWLRRFRIDELPQILNVVKGEMGIVGPRPERPEFVAKLRRQIPYYDSAHAGAAGDHGLGADSLSVRRVVGRGAREAAVRPLVREAPLGAARSVDPLPHRQGRPLRPRRALTFSAPSPAPASPVPRPGSSAYVRALRSERRRELHWK